MHESECVWKVFGVLALLSTTGISWVPGSYGAEPHPRHRIQRATTDSPSVVKNSAVYLAG